MSDGTIYRKIKKGGGEEKYETGVHKVASYSDLKSRNKNLNLYQNIWVCALLSTCQFFQALQVL